MGSIYLLEDSELKAWAYKPELFEGVGQDFELTVATLHRSEIILQCASDNDCPKQCFFVCCAYQIVGDAVRSANHRELDSGVLGFIRRAEKTGNEHLLEFAWRAKHLIENTSEFDYGEWCCGLLARRNFSEIGTCND